MSFKPGTEIVMRRIIVNIDTLVLKGFAYEDRHAIVAAVQGEIARVLTARDAATRVAQLGSLANLRINDVSIAANAKAQQIGAASGRAIGNGLIK
jgi:hypothetical protein